MATATCALFAHVKKRASHCKAACYDYFTSRFGARKVVNKYELALLTMLINPPRDGLV